jgi:hypothetical protein
VTLAMNYPNLASAFNGLGVVRGSQDNLPEAVQNWKKAVEVEGCNKKIGII